jgi:hypothetical protein
MLARSWSFGNGLGLAPWLDAEFGESDHPFRLKAISRFG